MEAAAAIDFAEHPAAEAHGTDNACVDRSDLSGFRIDPDRGAGVSQQVGRVVVRLILRVRIQLKFFDDAAAANLAREPGKAVSGEHSVDEAGALLAPFLLLSEDGDFARIVGMDGDLEDVFPVAQLTLIESGGNGRAVLAQENPQSAAARRNDAKDFFVRSGAAGVVRVGDTVFDALEGVERGIVAMLVGDGAQHKLVNLLVGERSLVGRSRLVERGAVAGSEGAGDGKTERQRHGDSESGLGAAVHDGVRILLGFRRTSAGCYG